MINMLKNPRPSQADGRSLGRQFFDQKIVIEPFAGFGALDNGKCMVHILHHTDQSR